jgi:formate dehydrogenase subunit delta
VSDAKIDKLVRMANQIGDYFRTLPSPEAAAGAANHLRQFWTPKMIREIVAYTDEGHSGLNVTAAAAVSSLKLEKTN